MSSKTNFLLVIVIDELDVKLATIDQSFRHFLSLIPPAYQKDFNNLEIEGEFNFESSFNGIYSDNYIPSFDILLEINNSYGLM